MAEQASRKIAEQSVVADDDPFAELTRIMGFDPREPAKPAVVEDSSSVMRADPEPAQGAYEEVDLSIDLERELLGDFVDENIPGVADVPVWQAGAEQEVLSSEAEIHEGRAVAEADTAHHDRAEETANAASLVESDGFVFDYEGFPEEGHAAMADIARDEQAAATEVHLQEGFPDQGAAEAEEATWVHSELPSLSVQPEASVGPDFEAAFDEHLNALLEAEPESREIAADRGLVEAAAQEVPQGEVQAEPAAEIPPGEQWSQQSEAGLASSDVASQEVLQVEVSTEYEGDYQAADQWNQDGEADRAWPEVVELQAPQGGGETQYVAEDQGGEQWSQQSETGPASSDVTAQEVLQVGASTEYVADYQAGEQWNQQSETGLAASDVTAQEVLQGGASTEYVADYQAGEQWSQQSETGLAASDVTAQEVLQGEVSTEYEAGYQTAEQWNQDSEADRTWPEAAAPQALQGGAETQYVADYQAGEQWSQDGVTDRSWPEEADPGASQVELHVAAEDAEGWSQEVAADHVSLEAADLELPHGDFASADEVAYQPNEQPEQSASEDLVQPVSVDTEHLPAVAEAIDDGEGGDRVTVAEWHEEPLSWQGGDISFEPAASEEVEPRFDAYPLVVEEPVASNSVEADEVHVAEEAIQDAQPTPAEALELTLEQELNALLGNDLGGGTQPEAVQESAPAEHAAEPAQVRDGIDDDWTHVPLRGSLAGDQEWRAPPDGASAAHSAGQHHEEFPAADPTAAAPEPDLEFAFDDHAFEAALTSAVEVERADGRSDPAAGQAEQATSRDDPYAALAALSASLRSPRYEPQNSEPTASFASRVTPTIQDDVPEIETIDVPERAVALADDLELPELAYETEPLPAPGYDDLDAEFSSLLEDMNLRGSEMSSTAEHAETREIRLKAPADPNPFGHEAAVAASGAALAGTVATAGATQSQGYDASYAGRPDAATYLRQQSADQSEHNEIEFSFDPDQDEDFAAPPPYVPAAENRSRSRGLIVAAVVGGVAVLGGLGAFAMSIGSGPGGGEIAMVKADPAPVKVKPENPGGVSIPNQDSKVYDTVAGAGTVAEPTQEKLLSSAEEPVEIPMPEDEPFELPGVMSSEIGTEQSFSAEGEADTGAEPGAAQAAASSAKSEDRIEQAAGAAGVDDTMEVAAVAPRKVRTMIVKADGTLVPREDLAPAVDNTVDSASESIVNPVPTTTLPAGDEVGTAEAPAAAGSSSEATTAAPANSAVADQIAAAQPDEAGAQTQGIIGTTPERAPIAPARPSDQPLDIVGEVKPQQVAAVAPGASGGSWSMQIASQPTEAAAQSSYQDLLRRYGGVLEGKEANIVKAEVAGKGTFWRVRIPAGSRNDAVNLCESYKAAGGSCFVTR